MRNRDFKDRRVITLFGVAAALLGACAAATVSGQELIGVSPVGKVTAFGHFQQSIPLQVPVYHGLEPQLGLEHAPESGNGMAGWGWRLAGLAVISRVQRRTGLPAFDATDEFVLDGVPLVPCALQQPRGVSCASGGTHGLRRETYQRVTKEGADWLVWDRNGTRSRFVSKGPSGIQNLRYVLAEKLDTHGNRLTYTHWCDGADECYPQAIAYHDHVNSERRTRVEYRWESRPDPFQYAQGTAALVTVRYRLQGMVVFTNGTVRNALAFNYHAATWGRWAGASRLRNAVRYGRDAGFDASGRIVAGTALPAESFAYESEATAGAWLPPLPIAPAASAVTPAATDPFLSRSVDSNVPWAPLPGKTEPIVGTQQWLPLDANGDGLDDVVALVYEGAGHPGTVKAFTHLNRGDGRYRQAITQNFAWSYYLPYPSNIPIGQQFLTGDFNGDGLVDLCAVWADASDHHETVGQMALSDGQGRFAAQPRIKLPAGRWGDDRRWLVGDFDGDLRDDVALVLGVPVAGRISAHAPRLQVLRSNGTTLIPLPAVDAPWSYHSADVPYWFAADIDADGRSDILRTESLPSGGTANATSWGVRVGVARSNGAGGFSFSVTGTRIPNWSPVQAPAPRGYRPLGVDLVKLGDFDANGLPDLVLFTPRGPSTAVDYDHLLATVLLAQPGGGFDTFEQELSLGIGRQNSFSGLSDSFPNRWLASDVDADGATDLVVVTAPFAIVAESWPQQTLVITLRSNRDGTFDGGAIASRNVAVPFDCWDRVNTCVGGPMFEALPADVNGDQRGDLLFVRYAQSNGIVGLTLEPSARRTAPEQGWLSADLSGDGRADFFKLDLPGSEVIVTGAIASTDGVEAPRQTSARIIAGSWIGVDPRRWRFADVGSPGSGAPDGKVDLVYIGTDASSDGLVPTDSMVLLSNGDGQFTARRSRLSTSSASHHSAAWRLGDFNGDGRSDLVRLTSPVRAELALSRGDGTWAFQEIAVPGIPAAAAIAGVQTADVDGDSWSDLLLAETSVDGGGGSQERVHTLRFTLTAAVTPQLVFMPRSWDAPPSGVPVRAWRAGDFNGDGYIDLAAADFISGRGVIHLRSNADAGTNWVPGAATTTLASINQRNLQIIDADGDGCHDFLWPTTLYGFNTRARWLLNKCDGRYDAFSDDIGSSVRDTASFAVAALGPDARPSMYRVTAAAGAAPEVRGYMRAFGRALLSGVENGIGLSLTVRYGTSAGRLGATAFGRASPVVSELRGQVFPLSSGPGVTSKYRYADARWSSRTREFLGFANVAVSEGTTLTTTHYSQTDGCRGNATRLETGNGHGVFWADISQYHDTSSQNLTSTAPWRCERRNSHRETCELGTSCRISMAEERTYDDYGNVVEFRGGGDPATPRDDRTVRHRYFPNTAAYIVDAAGEAETLDAQGARVTLLRMRHDGAASHMTPPTRGAVTHLEAWDSTANVYRITERRYDAAGNETENIDAAGRSVRTAWDPDFSRFPLSRCNAVWCDRTAWDVVLGVKTEEEDGNHKITRHRHDAVGRHLRTDFPDGGCVMHAYLDWGRALFDKQRTVETRCTNTTASDGPASGLQQVRHFDGMQRVWRETRTGGYERVRRFDGWSARLREESQWRSLGGQLWLNRYQYDDAHRVTTTVLPDGQERTTEYRVGSIIESSPTGARREIERDGWGRIAAVSEHVLFRGRRVPARAVYEYDALDRLISAADPAGKLTTWKHTSLGWVEGECDPDRGCMVREFDPTGVLTQETDATGARVRFTLDPIGRVVLRVSLNPKGAVVGEARWDYDRLPSGVFGVSHSGNVVGRVAVVSDANGSSSTRSYDAVGRLARERICVAKQCAEVQTDWDRVGRLARVAYPDAGGRVSRSSETLTYGYDAAGRVTSAGKYMHRIDYEPDDAVAAMAFGNGVVQTFQRDPARRWISGMDVAPPQGAGSRWTYQFDPDARVTGEQRSGLVASQRAFTYDASGRVLRVTGAQRDSFDYDLAGNLLDRATVGRYSYGDPGHPNAVTSAGSITASYDAAGRLVSRAAATFDWLPLNRLSSVQMPTGRVEFEYFAEGGVARRRDAATDRMFFGSWVERENGAWTYNYLLGGRVFAQGRPNGSVRYLHRDRLGSVTEVTDQRGNVVDLLSYDTFGASTSLRGLPNDQRFAEGREHRDLGLVELGARMLDPVLARFISPDPVVPNVYRAVYLNRYVYARNNPLNVVDPSGYTPPDEHSSLKKMLDRAASAAEGAKPAICCDLPPENGPDVPQDPLDVMLAARRGMFESFLPALQLLRLPGIRSMAKGVGADLSGGGCAVFCFLNADVNVGVYLTPPSSPGDTYFNDVHVYFSTGGAVLGATPNSGVDLLSPAVLENSNVQWSGGLSAGAGVSLMPFLSQALTPSEYAGWSRQLAASAGPISASMSVNTSGQKTFAAGYGVSVGGGAQVTNSHTWISGGVLNTFRGVLSGQK
jgi:RHS repeat-associated protein